MERIGCRYRVGDKCTAYDLKEIVPVRYVFVIPGTVETTFSPYCAGARGANGYRTCTAGSEIEEQVCMIDYNRRREEAEDY